MPKISSNGIMIEYEVSGPEDGRALLLIHGVGAQLVRWPPEFVAALAKAGFRVIRFDNRDVGLSTHLPEAGVPDFAAVMSAKQRGEVAPLAYGLGDMAADAFGLLDALGVRQAHVVGVSMGGMIAQQMAIDREDRLYSLAIFMSQSGNPELPPSDPAAMRKLQEPAPDPMQDRAGFLDHSVALNRALGSQSYPSDDADLRILAGLAADRCYDPAGAARHLAASRAAPDRRTALQQLTLPTLVIHGADDPLIFPAGGEDIARNVKDAWLLIVRGMGHDMPAALCPMFASLVAANCDRV